MLAPNMYVRVPIPTRSVGIYDGPAILTFSIVVNSSPFSFSALSNNCKAFGVAFADNTAIVTKPTPPIQVKIVGALCFHNRCVRFNILFISSTPFLVICVNPKSKEIVWDSTPSRTDNIGHSETSISISHNTS